jgi:hypothetical protein
MTWNEQISKLAKFNMPATLPGAMVVVMGNTFRIHAVQREYEPRQNSAPEPPPHHSRKPSNSTLKFGLII